MTTNFHTPLVGGESNAPGTWNTPLAALDAAISAVSGAGGTFTLANGAAAAAQKIVTVDSSSGFVAGASVVYTLVGGAIETNTIDTVDSATQITLTTNIGTGGIANNGVIAQVTPDVAAARGNYDTMTARLNGIDGLPGAARLGASSAIGASGITLRSAPDTIGTKLGYVIIDPYTANCEIRRVASRFGTTVNLDPIVNYTPTSTTISFTGTSITDSAGRLYDFRHNVSMIGSSVTVTGSASNNGTYTIASVAPGTITISGATLVTESSVQATLSINLNYVHAVDTSILFLPSLDEVRPEWFGAIVARHRESIDGYSDTAAAIAKADLHASMGGIVRFGNGQYRINTTIIKSAFSIWIGAGGGRPGEDRYGTVLKAKGSSLNSAAIVEIEGDSTGGQSYWGLYSGGIRDMAVHGDDTNGTNVFSPSAAMGIRIGSSVRQQFFSGVNCRWLTYGFHSAGGGELLFDRCFVSACKYGFYFPLGLTDSYFRNCLGGSGTTSSLETEAGGGAGFYMVRANVVTFEACRFQVQKSGRGGNFQSCVNLQFDNCIFDNNEQDGIFLRNCANVSINEPLTVNNGLTSAKRAGIDIDAFPTTISAVNTSTETITMAASLPLRTGQVVHLYTAGTYPAVGAGDALATGVDYWVIRVSDTDIKLARTRADADAGTAIDLTDAGTGTIRILPVNENITITGGQSWDWNAGNASEVQDRGIRFTRGVTQDVIRQVTIANHNLVRLTTAIENLSYVTNPLLLNCTGVATNYLREHLMVDGLIAIKDRIGANPSLVSGYAQIYVDVSDGDLKIIFDDGIVRRIIRDNAPSAYTVVNGLTDRAYDANATTLDEIADILATLIADLQAEGHIG